MSGPGFDVIGLALSMYLELRVTITKSASSPSQQPDTPSLNCSITYTGVSPTSIDLLPSSNLLTRSSLYLLRCHGLHGFPHPTSIHIHNPIPLGRGLGSSGAAVVAGILLGNLALTSHSPHLSLDKPRLLDYCLMIERHPDNVAAALYGGFVGTYLNELDPVDMARKEIPLSEVLPAPAGGVDTGLKPPEPPVGIGHFRRFRWAREIRAVAVIPDFEVSTARAREVLPGSYTRQDMVGSVLSCYLFYSPPIVCCLFFSFPRFSYQDLPFLPITS
jgi:homoserine kinase